MGLLFQMGKNVPPPPPWRQQQAALEQRAHTSYPGTTCLGTAPCDPLLPPLFFKLPGIATEKLPNVQSPQPIHAYPFKLDQTGASKWRLSSTLKLKLGCCVLFFRHYACSLGTRLILNPNNFPLNQILKVVIATTMLG